MTLQQQLALAVLKDDGPGAYLAALALADQVLENNRLSYEEQEAIRDAHRRETAPASGYDVYRWPEFRAFCKRLGIPWELPTYDIVITIPHEGMVRIDHSYQGRGVGFETVEPGEGPGEEAGT